MTKMLPHYVVTADRNTGAWLGEPECTGACVNAAEWHAKVDTTARHFDTYEAPDGDDGKTETRAIVVTWINAVTFDGRTIDLDAARRGMDDELCEAINGTVDSEQEFLDAYLAAHEAKFGEPFAFN